MKNQIRYSSSDRDDSNSSLVRISHAPQATLLKARKHRLLFYVLCCYQVLRTTSTGSTVVLYDEDASRCHRYLTMAKVVLRTVL